MHFSNEILNTKTIGDIWTEFKITSPKEYKKIRIIFECFIDGTKFRDDESRLMSESMLIASFVYGRILEKEIED